MRAALALGLALAAATTAPARADDARRKATPDKFAQAAGAAFNEAAAADQAGDLRTAHAHYQRAYAISPHPSTIYNLADVERRMGHLLAAQRSYETYLALLPDAPDRREVEALVEQLARTPGRLLVMTAESHDPQAVDLQRAYVLVDGEVKIKPGTAPAPFSQSRARTGFELEVPPGDHVVDVVTAITHGTDRCRVEPGDFRYCRVTAKPRVDGRVVVAVSERPLVVRAEPQGRSLGGERVELPPGRRELLVRDRSYECRAIPVEVPPGGDVLHVFVGAEGYRVQRCRALLVRQQRLRFAP